MRVLGAVGWSVASVFCAMALAACEDDASTTVAPSVDGGGTFDTPSDGGGTYDAPSSDAGDPVVHCPAPTGGPTEHGEPISKDEVWTAAASPHVLTWDVGVRDGATLTIEPCAEILVPEGKDLYVSGEGSRILAEGTATNPIRIAGHGGAKWKRFLVAAPATARLAYVTLEGGGGGGVNDFDDATLEVRGNGALPVQPALFVDHVTVKGSRGVGVAVHGLATFIAGSRDLRVTESGSEKYPYAASIEEHSIDALPTGTYTGNRVDEILLRRVGSGTAGDGLKVDATLHNRGVPYHVGGSFNVAVNEDGKLATLTIEPGVVMKFEKGKWFEIEHWTGESPATGAVRALGTAKEPIVLTSAEAAPKPGDWGGLWFGNVPSSKNKLDHVVIEYAGASCSCSLATCSAISSWEGAVLLTDRPASGTSFITNTTFRHVSGHGVVEGWSFASGDPRNAPIDFSTTNTFDVTGCVQTLPGNTVAGGCPSPRPACW